MTIIVKNHEYPVVPASSPKHKNNLKLTNIIKKLNLFIKKF